MRKLLTVGLILSVICMYVPTASASEVSILVQKLVDKQILTTAEAQAILNETKQAVAPVDEYGVPDWTRKIRLKGDLRTRYEYISRNNNGRTRQRGRIRFRLGGIAQVNEQVEVGFGFATGDSAAGANSRSTNQSLDMNFDSKNLWLDYAYAKYTPFEWAEIYAGKFKNPLWTPSDLLWDSDINPEGVSVGLQADVNDNVSGFLNSSFFVLDEAAATTNEPTMWVFQPGFTVKADNVQWKNAFTLYLLTGEHAYALSNSAGTNTNPGNDWSVGAFSTELSLKVEENDFIRYAALFGDAVYNPDTSDPGFLGGIKFGDKKVKKFGQWQAKALYRYLERNAWLDTYPDADVLSGGTGTKGAEVILQLGLADNVVFGLDYYNSSRISDGQKENRLQLDLVYKF